MVEFCFATLNHSPLVAEPHERVDIVRQIDATAEAGFATIELDVFSLRAWRENGGTLRDVVQRLDDQGLSCYALAGLNVYDDHARSVTEVNDLAEMCAALKPRWLLLRLAGSLEPGLEFLRQHLGLFDPTVQLGFEPSPFTVLRTIGDASAAVDAIGSGAVIVDSWHFFATGADWDALAALPDERLAYVQLDDALEPSADLQHDTMHRRALPGEGNLDLARFTSALRDRGFDGVVSLEVLSDTWRRESVEAFTAAARRSVDSLF
ncbi:MAG: sugar phosphate isomerase/epimerase family protein [Acidimicrobiales bacterium]